MVIRLHNLEIRNFRGIKSLDLNLKGHSIAILGPNGTGKSSVVDALDFLLTGNVRRLSGEGAQELKLAEHGRHIDAKKGEGVVVGTFQSVEGGKPTTLRRVVANAGELETSGPTRDELTALVDTATDSGSHLLTRREILRFILAAPGKRADQVNSVLEITEIDTWRRAFDSARKKAKASVKEAEAATAQQEAAFLRSVDPPVESPDAVLARANMLRDVLGLEPLQALDDKHDLDEGAVQPTATAGNPLRETAVRGRLASLETWFAAESQRILHDHEEYAKEVASIRDTPGLEDAVALVDLVSRGLDLLRDDACPLCRKPWELEELRKLLEDRLAEVDAARRQLERLDERREVGCGSIETVVNDLRSLAGALTHFDDDASGALSQYADALHEARGVLFPSPLDEPQDPTDAVHLLRDTATSGLVARLGKAADAAESPDEAVTAWEELRGAARTWKEVQEARRQQARAEAVARHAVLLSKLFAQARDEVLGDVWASVSKRFSELYCSVHGEDEATFSAELGPKGAGLDLKVDFYGHGKHPPHALHSEGHQDSMGVFLFLSLAESIAGGAPPFVILDDVVMSVDRGHRRAIATMLRERYPETQFVITTHDPVWWRQLRSEQVVMGKNALEISDWTLEDGPNIGRDPGDFLKQAREHLDAGVVPSAAHALRRACEAYLPELAHNLGAKVRFRGDGNFVAGEMMDAVKSEFGSLCKKARKSAESWKKPTDWLDDFDEQRKQIFMSVGQENWAVNAMVHENPWAQLGKEDFRAVLEAYDRFFTLFTCKTCGSVIRVVEEGGTATGVRCPCDDWNWNLVVKGS